jgi:hypothetical protein
MLSVNIAELLPGARPVVVGWVKKTQNLYKKRRLKTSTKINFINQ